MVGPPVGGALFQVCN